jgi:ferredoxin
MRSAALSKIRVIFSIALIISLAVLFVDIGYILPEKYITSVLYLQFIPSAVKFIAAGTITASGFVIVIILTFLTGRTYCSFLCPLGIMQDIFSRLGGKIKKRFRRYGFKKPHTALRYSLLAITLIIVMIWGIYSLSILDPYSIFGRTMTYFARPLITVINNLLSEIFGSADIYTFVNQPVIWFSWTSYVIPALFIILIGYFSLVKGRLFCNTVCPLGTILGLISKASLLRVRFDEILCNKCGRCATACKSSCIDFLSKEIDVSRCVDCFNCISHCPEKAMTYAPVLSSKSFLKTTSEPVTQRRSMIVAALMFFFGYAGKSSSQEKSIPVPKKESTVKEEKTVPVSPPGSTGISNFTDKCTACSLCISICPNNVLFPSFREYGLASIMQPYLNFRKGFCAYECTKCLEICPSGAILPLETEAKKLTQIGKSVFIEDNCIVKTEKTACGACAESCPTKAVHMVPYEGKLVIPETNDKLCIGCGHCEYACPTIPYKAIYVNGNTAHKAAEKPVNTKTDIVKPEDFPF